MSLNWDFKKDFMGTAKVRYTDKDGKLQYHIDNLYKGNALFLQLIESKKQYQLTNFACDKAHLINCLKDEVYRDYVELNFNGNYIKEAMIIAEAFLKYAPDVKIIFTKKVRKKFYANI